MQKVMNLVDSLYREIIQNHSRLSDTQYVLPPQKIEYLRQMALANNQTLALVNPGLNCYNFIHVRNSDFKYLFKEELSVDDFLSHMHKDDLSHFLHAWEIVFGVIAKMNTDDLLDYVLVFECRILDCHQKYQRVMFKYKVVSDDDDNRKGQLLMFLKTIDGCKTDEPSGGIYLVNLKTKTIDYAEKDHTLSNREIEVIQHSQKGLMSEEIASILNISKNTVNNHRRNVLQKLSVRDHNFAAGYLHEMGII